MSLVHQALRKAEQEKLRKTGVVPAAAAPTSAVPAIPAPPPGGSHSPALHRDEVAGAGVATVSPPATPAASDHRSMLLPVLISCVAFVAIVAIVFLVLRDTVSVREGDAPAEPSVMDSSSPPPSPTPASASTDPAPPAPQAAPPSSVEDRYSLTGILQDPDGRWVAVVNGRSVYETHYVDGAVVTQIEHDRVTLDVKGQTIVKRLF